MTSRRDGSPRARTEQPMRTVIPVPKPLAKPDKQKAAASSAGLCTRCGGAGEYEWGDGYWKRCLVCHPEEGQPGDEDV